MQPREHTLGISHNIHTYIQYLFLVLPPRRVQGLDECGCVSDKHSEAGSSHYHAEDGQPHVSHAYGGVQAVSDAQHVTHGLKQGIGVLLLPRVIL